MRKALLIEDSPEYQHLVRSALVDRFAVVVASNADEALTEVSKNTFDLILIDVGLPGRDGLSLCEEMRKDPRLSSTPILFVTGRKEAADVVLGFAAGADDYIQKPFHPDELRVRIDARLKRAASSQASADQFAKGELKFFVGRQKVSQLKSSDKGGEATERDLELTPNEFKILYHLAKHEGRTLSRADILREVWGENLHVVERTVDKHICSLRRKMGALSQYVASVPGEGYVFRSQVKIVPLRSVGV